MEHRETLHQEEDTTTEKEAGRSAITGTFFQHHPRTACRGSGAHIPSALPVLVNRAGWHGIEVPRVERAGLETELNPCPPRASDRQPISFRSTPWSITLGLPLSFSHDASPLLTPCSLTAQTLKGSWPGLDTHTAHYIQSHPRCLLQPPSSYPTRWESSCRLWARRKLALGAGTGGGGAAVMSRETDDNRQTDGTGARGRCASNAHPRPSFGARQSGTQNGIPGERWSRVRGPQLWNLRVEGDLGACQLHLGKRGRATGPGAQNWTRPWFLLFLIGEDVSPQGKGNGYSSHNKILF